MLGGNEEKPEPRFMMAAQAPARPMARWETGKTSSGGIIGQITAVFTSPKTFFRQMPRTRQ